jgi:hypothetical protein
MSSTATRRMLKNSAEQWHAQVYAFQYSREIGGRFTIDCCFLKRCSEEPRGCTHICAYVCVKKDMCLPSHQRWHTLFLSVIKKIISLPSSRCFRIIYTRHELYPRTCKWGTFHATWYGSFCHQIHTEYIDYLLVHQEYMAQ